MKQFIFSVSLHISPYTIHGSACTHARAHTHTRTRAHSDSYTHPLTMSTFLFLFSHVLFPAVQFPSQLLMLFCQFLSEHLVKLCQEFHILYYNHVWLCKQTFLEPVNMIFSHSFYIKSSSNKWHSQQKCVFMWSNHLNFAISRGTPISQTLIQESKKGHAAKNALHQISQYQKQPTLAKTLHTELDLAHARLLLSL